MENRLREKKLRPERYLCDESTTSLNAIAFSGLGMAIMQLRGAVCSHPPVLAVLLGISLAAILMAMGCLMASILASCCLCIAAFYYNMIHLYSECDGYMGAVPSNRRMYFTGFFVVVTGFTGIALGYVTAFPISVQVGAIVLFIGLVLLLAATKNLFDRIIRSGIA